MKVMERLDVAQSTAAKVSRIDRGNAYSRIYKHFWLGALTCVAAFCF